MIPKEKKGVGRRRATGGEGRNNREAKAARAARAARATKATKDGKDGKDGKDEARGGRSYEVFGIVTLACALLVGPALASVQFGQGQLIGPFGYVVGAALHWTFGLAGYLVVAVLLGVALRIFAAAVGRSGPSRPTTALWRKRVGLLALAAATTVLLHLVFRPERLGGSSYGGIVGELVAEVLCAFVSTPGAWILSVAGLALGLVLATTFSWARGALAIARVVGRSLRGVAIAAGRARARIAAAARFAGEQLGQQLGELRRNREVSSDASGTAAMPPVMRLGLDPAERETPVIPRPVPLPADLEIGRGDEPCGPPAPPEIAGPRWTVQPEPQPVPAPAPEPEPVPAPEPEPEPEPVPVPEPAGATPEEAPSETQQAQAAEEVARQDEAAQQKAPGPADDPASAGNRLTIVESQFHRDPSQQVEAEAVEEPKPDGPGFVLHGESYRPPPLSLLAPPDVAEQSQVDREAIYRQAERLATTLADYKIFGRVTKVHPGPVVTMYEFVPAPGTRISKVANLANDLAMSLEAQRVRIVAPIPGKGAIGIEVPNESREIVSFREIVADESFRNPKARLALALGKNIFGAPVTMDLARMPHLLVAGATGAGKSVSINSMICSLLLKNRPEEVRLIMVDPKFLELSGYNDIPHLLL
ncbi:MAG: DNA translocase FtsK 4TM domain-containing protein, partial [Planctomycetota bacterium]